MSSTSTSSRVSLHIEHSYERTSTYLHHNLITVPASMYQVPVPVPESTYHRWNVSYSSYQVHTPRNSRRRGWWLMTRMTPILGLRKKTQEKVLRRLRTRDEEGMKIILYSSFKVSRRLIEDKKELARLTWECIDTRTLLVMDGEWIHMSFHIEHK